MIVKKITILITLGLLSIVSLKAQGVAIGDTEYTPDESAILDIRSSDKGLLIPKIALTDANSTAPVSNPANGLMIYNTTDSGDLAEGFYYWNGSKWMRIFIGNDTDVWGTQGNSGSISGVNFIGTVDNQDFDIRTNDTIHARISTNGQLEFLNTGNSIFIGESAGENDDHSDNNNFFIGKEAGFNFTDGEANIAIGNSSMHGYLSANSTGNNNLAIGHNTLEENITASNNIAVGNNSQKLNHEGDNNISIGNDALKNNTNAYYNIALGNASLHSLNLPFSISPDQIKTFNIAIGDSALFSADISEFSYLYIHSQNNIAIGYNSHKNGTYSRFNTSIGNKSLENNRRGENNVAIGVESMNSNISYDKNIAIGNYTLYTHSNLIYSTTQHKPTYNIAIGDSALFKNNPTHFYLYDSCGTNNIAIGHNSNRENINGKYNISIGNKNMCYAENSHYNTSIGNNSMMNLQNGNCNTSIGYESLLANTKGCSNTAIGYKSLQRNVKSSRNTAVGYESLNDNHGDFANNNTAIGYRSIASNYFGAYNTAFGVNTLSNNIIGSSNISIGSNSMLNNKNANHNIAIGNNTLYKQQVTNEQNLDLYNLAIGDSAMYYNTTDNINCGNNNVAIGHNSLKNNSTGHNNLTIGNKSGYNISTGSNNIIIGNNVYIQAPDASNRLNIGNIIFGNNINGNQDTISTGNIGIGVADPSEKLDINGQIRMREGAVPGYTITSNSDGVMTWTDPATAFSNCYWSQSGNTGTVSGINFIGTKDNQDLDFRTNNTIKARITTKGQIEIMNTGNSIFIGEGAGENDDLTDNNNIFIGYQCGNSNTTGFCNSANGYQTLKSNTSGVMNTAFGYRSLSANTSGSGNTAIGMETLDSNTIGTDNTANGFSTLHANSTGSYNTANGSYALFSNTTGSKNIAIGYFAGDNITTGSNNIVIGNEINAPINGDNQLNIGNIIYGINIDGTGSTISTGNIGIGVSLPSNKLDINGQIRMRAGAASGYIISSDANGVMSWTDPATILANDDWSHTGNTGTVSGVNFIGTTDNQDLDFRTNNTIKLRVSTKGQLETFNTGRSVFIGEGAGENDDLSDNESVFVGFNSGFSNSTGYKNTAVGFQSLYSNTTGNYNSAIGYNSLQNNTSGSQNTAFGFECLRSLTTGSYNIASGYLALEGCTTGRYNIGIGSFALNDISSTNYNTAIGNSAGSDLDNLTQSSTYIGYDADATVNSTPFNYSVAIGQRSRVSASQQVRIGNGTSNPATSIGGPVAWTNTSDGRFKVNVQENVPGIEFITKLRPVTYNFDNESLNDHFNVPDSCRDRNSSINILNTVRTGFIAQEVESAAKECDYEFSGVDAPKNENDIYGLRYAEFVVPLVKATQEQQILIEEQRSLIEEQAKTIEELTLRIEALENK